MNKRKLYLCICISLTVGSQVTLHNNVVVYAYNNKNFDKINITNKKLSSIKLMSYAIDDTWTVIDTTSIPETETLDKVIGDYMADGKMKFYIKNGEYILNESININKSGIIIQGESKENTKIIQNNSAINAITVTENDVEVSNLTIDSSHGRTAFSTSDSQTINNVKLHDCIIYGSPYVFAVAFYGTPYTNDVEDNAVVESGNLAQGNIIENNEIHAELSEVSNPEADGILFTKQKGGTINNNKIYGRRIAFYLSRDSKVTNNEIHDSSTNGIRCAVPALDNEISGNTIDNSKASGISLVRNNGSVAGDYRASNIDIKGNVISNSKYFGIEINNLMNSEISGNKLSDIAFNGIYIVLSDELTVAENKIDNCSLSVSEGSDWDWDQSRNSGIFLDSDVKNSNFNNNIVSQFKVDVITNKPFACPYGIKIQAGRNNLDNTILSNTIKGYFKDGIDVPEIETVISGNSINLIPINLTAEGISASEIHLSWDSIDDVDSYNVYRSDSENGEYIKVNTAGVISNTYEDTGLEPGKTYYYRITAVNGSGESENSLTVSAATIHEIPIPTLPGIPVDLQAIGMNESTIRLNWGNVSGAQSYNIYRSDSENGEYVKVNNNEVTANSYEDTGLESGQTYYYRITAVNETEESDKSTSANAATLDEIPIPVLPGVPAGLHVTGTDKSKIGLSWDIVLGADSYNVYRSDSENGEYVKVNTAGVISNTYKDTGLESGQTYFYKVTAVNETDESAKSPFASATTVKETVPPPVPPKVLPKVPEGLIVESMDEYKVKLSWYAAMGAKGYNVYRSDSENGEYVKVNNNEVTANGYEDMGLESGKTYYYRITAVNEAGESEKSESVSVTTLPEVPKGLKIEVIDKIKISLSWNIVPGAKVYNVYRSDSENGEYMKVNNIEVTASSYEDTGLEPGKTYYYKISAINESGESEKSESVSVLTLLEIPGGLGIESTDKDKVKLKWDSVSGVTAYNVYRSDSENGEYVKVNNIEVTASSYEDTGLEPGKTYYYKISAINESGESEKSESVSVLTLPEIPGGLGIESTDKDKVKLKWDSVSGVMAYNVYRSDSENGEYVKVNNIEVTASSYEDTRLESDKTYFYKITGVNESGESDKSTCVSCTTKSKYVDNDDGKTSKTIIKRIYGNNGIEASVSIAEELFKNGKPDAVVLASSADFPDALSGSVLAYRNNAPLLLVGKSLNENKKVLSYIFSNLEKSKNIYVLGGAAAVNMEVSDYLDKQGYNIIRLGGKDRYETNYKIIDSLGVKKGTPIIVVSGNNFGDSLGILSVACKNGYPILMTNNTLSANAIKYIHSIQPDKVYVVGEKQVLSDNIEAEIGNLFRDVYITRLEGGNIYETSIRIVDEFSINSNIITITSGMDFPYAVTGSLLAAKNNSNILLVDNNNIRIQTELLKHRDIKNLIILGGEDVININTVRLLMKNNFNF
ncbi:fibronectin type III domain-containing protein [Clostridium sp. LBM24168]